MANICVTGAAGHIGSALLKPLGEVHNLTVIDNLSTQRYPSLYAENLPASGIRFIEGDICTHDLKSLFRGQDIVIHLAAITDAATSATRPADVYWVNLHGTERVAEACLVNGCRMFLPSTTSVYGKAEGVVDETCEELHPQSPYATSKLRAEDYLRSVAGLRFVIMRFGTIFGVSQGMRFHTAINSFSWSAATGKPIKIWITANHQKRPYLYLGDCISAIQHAIDKDLFNGETYNVLTGNWSPHDIVQEIRKHRNDLGVQMVSSAIMNQLSYTTAYGKILKTGWTPRGTLESGIAETMGLLSRIHR